MSSYLEHLVTRVLTPGNGIRPRQASIFEPVEAEERPLSVDERLSDEPADVDPKDDEPTDVANQRRPIGTAVTPMQHLRRTEPSPSSRPRLRDDSVSPPLPADADPDDAPPIAAAVSPSAISGSTRPSRPAATEQITRPRRDPASALDPPDRTQRAQHGPEEEPVQLPVSPDRRYESSRLPSPARHTQMRVPVPEMSPLERVPVAVPPMRVPMRPMPIGNRVAREESDGPVVHVTIGRVVVRARTDAASPRSTSASHAAAPTLDEYLRRRQGGRR